MDISIISRPWKFGDIWVTMFYLIGYLIFQVIYIVLFEGTDMYDNDYVYSILKWKSDPLKSSCIAFGVILSAVLVHTILYFFAKNRNKPREKLISNEYDKAVTKDGHEDGNYNNANVLHFYIYYILYINGHYTYMLSYMVYLFLYILYIHTLTIIYQSYQVQDSTEADNEICLIK